MSLQDKGYSIKYLLLLFHQDSIGMPDIRRFFKKLNYIELNRIKGYLESIEEFLKYMSMKTRIDPFISKNIDYWFLPNEAEILKKQTLPEIRDAFTTLINEEKNNIDAILNIINRIISSSDKYAQYYSEISNAKRDEGNVKFKQTICPYCKEKKPSDALQIHIQLQHKDKVKIKKEKCPYCLQSFKPSDLVQHIEDDHRNHRMFQPDFDAFINQ